MSNLRFPPRLQCGKITDNTRGLANLTETSCRHGSNTLPKFPFISCSLTRGSFGSWDSHWPRLNIQQFPTVGSAQLWVKGQDRTEPTIVASHWGVCRQSLGGVSFVKRVVYIDGAYCIIVHLLKYGVQISVWIKLLTGSRSVTYHLLFGVPVGNGVPLSKRRVSLSNFGAVSGPTQ